MGARCPLAAQAIRNGVDSSQTKATSSAANEGQDQWRASACAVGDIYHLRVGVCRCMQNVTSTQGLNLGHCRDSSILHQVCDLQLMIIYMLGSICAPGGYETG